MKPGDLVFVKNSNVLKRSKPLIILEKYQTVGSVYFEVLDPGAGFRYHYQEHDLVEDLI